MKPETPEMKRALVTGAASGIGLAIVREFHAKGMQVIASDLSGPKLEEVFASLPGVRCLAAYLSQKDAVARHIEPTTDPETLATPHRTSAVSI